MYIHSRHGTKLHHKSSTGKSSIQGPRQQSSQSLPLERAAFLQSHLMEAVEEFINSGAEPAEKMIRDMVECELAFINTDHPAFLGGNRAIGMVMEVKTP